MIMKKSAYSEEEMLERIEAYFDCTLTDQEERNLRRDLATTTLRHPAIDEARALMGFACPPQTRKADKRGTAVRRLAKVASVAAAVAVLVSVTLFIAKSHGETEESTCYAYVDGRKVTDEAAVEAILRCSLREAGESEDQADMDMMADLAGVAGLVEIYESEKQLYF